MVKDKKLKELQWAYLALAGAFALLIVIGMASVFSTTFVTDRVQVGNPYDHLIKQGVLLAISFIPAWYIQRREIASWRPYILLGVIGTIFLLVAVLAMGVHVNGAKRWLGVGSFTFQPSELAKIVGVLYTASLLARAVDHKHHIEFFQHAFAKKNRTTWLKKHIKVPHISLWAPLAMAVLVFLQPDGGTGAVILAMPVVMLLVSGAHILRVKKWIFAGIAALILYFVMAPYRWNRIVSWWDPWAYAKTLGYQTVQSLTAIGSGGILGQGIGEGTFKFDYLPEAHTDFAFAILAQEWGLRGSVFVVAIFCVIIYFGIFTAWQSKKTFSMFTALGIALYFGGQGCINIGMVSGLLPVVGVPLPFISYGGTSLVVNVIAASLLLRIAKENYQDQLRQLERKRMVPVRHELDEERSQFPST